MIKINVNNIENWDTIIKYHNVFFKQDIKKQVENQLRNGILNDKNSMKSKIFKTLFLDDSDIVDENKLIKIATGKKFYLDKIKEDYKKIIFNGEESEYKYKLIKTFINSRCTTVKTIKLSLYKSSLPKSEEQKKFYDKVLENIKEAEIETKEGKERHIFAIEGTKFFKEIVEIEKVLKKIFNYDSCFSDNGVKLNVEYGIQWNRHTLLSMIGISVCPYCNRQYINNYINIKKKNKTTADLDHFYPKSEYPFLALSLYNFIPSCQICNSRFKLASDKSLIYPYEEEFGEFATFKTNFYTYDDVKNKNVKDKEDTYDVKYLMGMSDNFKIELSIDMERVRNYFLLKNEEKQMDTDINKITLEFIDKIRNSKDIFHLEELYKCHKDYVRELIKKAIIYNESRIDELCTQYPDIFSSREEVLQMIVSNYICDEDLGKRPLAKLTKDIREELGLQ
ncbi:hypothetical protein I6U48_22280 [Clostridium sp. PL3]|uniref:HNH nuclease domain-containing protein n=1 Tax=Clostridium thailandense TaxID=2794346 RepID=A0A949WSZ5_9CLOT|nr:hypothetical protein [Clostridium thailandense]MBV7275631.1 hypothetical protein [Clostridium thailandense]